jgi:hypothetical protein
VVDVPDALDDAPDALADRAGLDVAAAGRAGAGFAVEVEVRVEAGVNDGLIPSAGSGGI